MSTIFTLAFVYLALMFWVICCWGSGTRTWLVVGCVVFGLAMVLYRGFVSMEEFRNTNCRRCDMIEMVP